MTTRPTTLDELRVDQPLPHALYTARGRLLAHAGEVFTEDMRSFLEAAKPAALKFDLRAEPRGVRPLRAAMPDQEHDAGPDHAEGSTPEAQIGEADIMQDRREWERRLLRTRAELRRSARALVDVSRARWATTPLTVDVGIDPVPLAWSRASGKPAALDLSEIPSEVENRLRELRRDGVALLRTFYGMLANAENADALAVNRLADDLIGSLSQCPELFAIPALGLPRPGESLAEHAYSTGAIAIAIAAQLGWPRADVRAAGVTGLLADCGMMLVPHAVRRVGRPLTDIERAGTRRHPEYTVAMLRQVTGLPERIVLAAYQHHERCDGTGYPENLRTDKLHDLARIVAVADAFAGMVAPRADRPEVTPRQAISELTRLAAGNTQQFDRAAIRALVDVLGLYPARSFVRLSSGHIAVVGAASPPGAGGGTAGRPVVLVVQPAGAARRFGQPIDLARIEKKKLSVVEAVRAPEGALV